MARSPAPSLCSWLCSRWCFKILRDCEINNFQECIILIYLFQLILMSVLSPFWCVGTVLPETNVDSPLTVPPSPDMMALKLQQVAAKTVPTHGLSKFLRKDREQRDNSGREIPVDCAKAKVRSQLIFLHWISPIEIHGGAINCSVYITRLQSMDWEMKGSTPQKSSAEPRPTPVMVL